MADDGEKVTVVEWIPHVPKGIVSTILRKPDDFAPEYDPTLWSKNAPGFAIDKQLTSDKNHANDQVLYPKLVVTLAHTVKPGDSILDVGCCGGYYSETIEKYVTDDFEYTGVDVTPEYIESARQKYPQRKWVVGDARDLPFPDRSFDHVLCFFLLIHLDQEGVRRVMDALTRVARKQILFAGYFAEARLSGSGKGFIYDVVALDELVRPGWRLNVLRGDNYSAVELPASLIYENGTEEEKTVLVPVYQHAMMVRE